MSDHAGDEGWQDRCRASVRAAFVENGLPPPVFYVEDTYIHTEFRHQGEVSRIEIGAHSVNMRQGERLYECYLHEELVSDEALRVAFCARLSRYLGGGPWEDPSEKELVEFRILRAVRGLWTRRT